MDTISTEERLELYRLFAAVFFTLPDQNFVRMIRQIQVSGDDNATQLLADFQAEIEGLSDEEVQQALRIDFARLLNGAVDQGARAPFESVYREVDVLDLLKQLNRQYRAWGYGFAETHGEQSDHIAKELGFMQMLCERELGACDTETLEQIQETEQEFLDQHLGPWVIPFAKEAGGAAQTKFYQAICEMLASHMTSELSSARHSAFPSTDKVGQQSCASKHQASQRQMANDPSTHNRKTVGHRTAFEPMVFRGLCPLLT